MSATWTIGFAVAILIVVVVVVLLLGIIYQTRRIIQLATVALEQVEQVEQNTMPIWQLNQTNRYTRDIADGMGALEDLLKPIAKDDQEKRAS
jgi:cell division protein FtsB